jgi:hypothetical protein
MKLKAFNLNEFCLCEADPDAIPPPAPVVPLSVRPVSGRNPVGDYSQGASSSGASLDRKKSTPPPMLDKMDEFISGKSGSTLQSGGSSKNLISNDSFATRDLIIIMIPNAQPCTVRIDEFTTLGDLLPRIARTHKLRLFSDEYAFAISPEDQSRLKIMSPIYDLTQCVQSLGVKDLELHKRVYADSVKVSVPTNIEKNIGVTAKVIAPPLENVERITYTG